MSTSESPGVDFPSSEENVAEAVFSPEDVALLERVLQDACSRAAPYTVINEAIRSSFAAAILEGAMHGIRDPDRLATFALRILPKFRSERPMR